MGREEQAYNADQLAGIRYAQEIGVDVRPYLKPEYRGACIKEIAIGLKEGLDVSVYADLNYTWRKMREIRLGMEQHLDVSRYLDPLYSYWQMREIRLGLKAGLDVSYYDSFMYTSKEMRKRRLMLKNRKNSPEISGDWTILGTEDYDLCIRPDGLRVYLNWHCRRAVAGVEELETILGENGIIYGIDHKKLEQVAQEYKELTKSSQSDRNTLVAKGTAPKDGKDGYYEWRFHARRRRTPKLKEDGSIDFDNMKWFDFVKKGEVLAVYHFAEIASDGTNVFGKKVPAKIGKEKPPLTGRGFELQSDLRTYVASEDGHVLLKEKELIVDDMLVLPQLDSSVEPLRYEGDVHIKGPIEGPVAIEVGGDLVVDGYVQNAQIQCGGSLILKGGINNSTGLLDLQVGGCVISRFFEYVTIHAGGNIHFGTSLNSDLFSYGEIVSYGEKSGIVGGNSYSEKGFCLTSIGNAAGIHTILNLGSNEAIHDLHVKAEKQAGEIKTVLAQLVTAQNQMHCRQNNENQTTDDMLHRIEHTIAEKKKELMQVSQRMEAIRRRDARARHSRIVVDRQVFENVQVHYLNECITIVPSSQITIKVHDGNLIMEKISGLLRQTA